MIEMFGIAFWIDALLEGINAADWPVEEPDSKVRCSLFLIGQKKFWKKNWKESRNAAHGGLVQPMT